MTTPQIYEDVESLSYDELINNLIAWMEIDIEDRWTELEQAQKNYEFFSFMLETALKLQGNKSPNQYVINKVRMILELVNRRRLLEKTVEGWERMTREEQIEEVNKSDEAVFKKYGKEIKANGR